EKINIEDIKPSSRRYPGIIFKQARDAGKEILSVKGLNYSKDGVRLINNLSFDVNHGDKITFLSKNSLATSALYQILNGEITPDSGTIEWGQTITRSYLPNENEAFFANEPMNLIDWLRQYSTEKDEAYIRGFLGKMLFSGEETLKMSNVLSGGEKVRCMLSRMMLTEANLLMLDEPTNHLDLETITALNNSLINFTGNILFTSRDHTFTHTIANRIIELGPNGFLDKLKSFDDYIEDAEIALQRKEIYDALIAV
ncbi:MAG: ABC-F family ATP-binding cassette domain-containing protein, partial [Saprospiraceae bacterium]|nr:ABC-F family ATP-binding cassette domain-containing protein [Saprospiraceae bacterium]